MFLQFVTTEEHARDFQIGTTRREIYSKNNKKTALYVMTASLSSCLFTGATVGHSVSTATPSSRALLIKTAKVISAKSSMGSAESVV